MCNVETDRLEAHQLQFHRLPMENRMLSQTSAMHPLLGNINSVARTPNNSTAKCFIWGKEHAATAESRPNPTEVSFAGQSLTKFPQHFLTSHSLILSLDLRENLLATFPTEVLKLMALKILRLDNNRISVIPPEIGGLVQLQILTLSRNCLRGLDPAMARLTLLTALVLNDNQLTDWPSWICTSLTRLRLLHLHGNAGIGGMPVTFPQMKQLGDLGFDWYAYLVPPVGRNVKGPQGQYYIAETRELCKRVERRAKGAGRPERDKKCTFFDFMSYFMKLESRNLAPPLYPKGRSPFHLAAMYGHIAVIHDYIRANCIDVNIQDSEGSTAFSLALRCNRQKVVRLLIACDRVDITKAGAKHGSPLSLAVLREQFDIAKRIVAKRRLDPNAADANGHTALHYIFAKFGANPSAMGEICALLVSRPDCKLNSLNRSLCAPLHCAARNQQDAAVRFAVEFNRRHVRGDHRFNFSIEGGKDGASLLHYIARHCDMETLALCLKNEKMNVFAVDSSGRTPRDLVKSSMSGRLLHRYEKETLRKMMLPAEEVERERSSSLVIATARNTNDISKNEEMTHAEINRATLWATAGVPEVRGSDSSDISEIDVPIDVISYSTNPPTMFEELHRMNDVAREPSGEDVAVEIVDNIPEESVGLKVLSVQMPPANADSFLDRPNKVQSGKYLVPQTTKAGGHFAFYNTQSFQARNVPLRGETEETGPSTTYGLRQRLGQISDEAVLVRNHLAFVYRTLMQREMPRGSMYRLVYHAFSEHSSDSEEVLSLLANRLDDKDPLKPDIVYLVGVLKSRRSIRTLDKLQERINGSKGTLEREVTFSRRNIKAGQNYLPVRYASRVTSPMAAHEFMLTMAAGELGHTAPISGEILRRKKEDAAKKIRCVHVNRTRGYFE